MKKDARFITVKILDHFSVKPIKLDLITNEIFSKFKPDPLIRPRVYVLSKEIIRFNSRLILMIEFISGRPQSRIDLSILSILRIAFYEIIMDDTVPDYAAVDSAVTLTNQLLNRRAAGFTNAVLRKLTRRMKEDKNWFQILSGDTKWHSLPNWMQERWKKQFGDLQFLKIVEKINQQPSSFVRVEIHKIPLSEVIALLMDEGIKSEEFSSSFLKVYVGSGKILKTNLFKTGKISIQDPASAAIVDCLNAKPGDTILDVCAAPGTKTLYLSNIVGEEGSILASDLNSERVSLGKKDLNRHGQHNIEWSIKDARKDTYPIADRILIDAPCTGTGVLSRRPDIRWICKPQDIKLASNKQAEILNNCSRFLKAGGTIVYATCSVEPEENWNVVDRFLKLNGDFSIVSVPSAIPFDWIDERGALRTLPHIHGVDGMFAVKLKLKQ
jgi:16S rRNA (cytosine967-C5)-methyltransferase